MKFTKHNNAKRSLNNLNIKFDEVRDCMADDGHVFGADYEFVDGEVIAFTRTAYLTAKDNGFPAYYREEEK